ncbi:MAG: FAD-dependent oxidoreductase [Desulfobacterales bacterium]|nr:MAG: FAD-dependent oxidoreductase [Desulfobacterales bacterium]
MTRPNGFETLLSPARIGSIGINNRIAMAPMSAPGIANLDGSPSEYYISFLEERARGGVGLIITGETVVDDGHRMISLGFHSRRMVSPYARLTEAIRTHGSKVFLQIAHPGGVCVRSMTGKQPVAPTSMKSPRYTETPRELSIGEIQAIIEKYVQTAYWAMEAGFDGVEMHAAHGFDLIGQFLSPSTNRRTDQYGGSFEGRIRFAEEIVRGVKNICGPDFPIGLKYNGYEAVDDGIDISLAKKIGQHMEEIGVDYLHVASMTFGLGGSEYPSVSPMYSKNGALIELAAEVKKGLKSIPVVGAGGINEPHLAERILKNREVDLLALGRAFFADPSWVDKVRSKRISSIRPCIRCNICHLKLFQNQLLKCTVNPFFGWQGKQEAIDKARQSKKVAVVGAGPAGVQAALVAEERGHDVTLYEQAEEVGGNLIPGSVPDFKADVRMLLQYYRQALLESSIDVKLGVEVSPTTIRDGDFDAVILAVGGSHIVPEVPGIDSESVVTASEVLDPHGNKDIGDEIIVLGAGHIGCETAWHLSLAGKSIKMVDIIDADQIIADDHLTNRTVLLKNLEMQGVQVLGNRALRELSGGNAIFETEDGRVETVNVDTVVLAVGFKPKKDIKEALGNILPDYCTYEVGDCARPGRLLEAIHSGKLAGGKI